MSHPFDLAGPRSSDWPQVDVRFQTQSDKAVCIREVEDSPDIWIPKALCHIQTHGLLPDSPPERGCIVTLSASARTLTEKGLL